MSFPRSMDTPSTVPKTVTERKYWLLSEMTHFPIVSVSARGCCLVYHGDLKRMELR